MKKLTTLIITSLAFLHFSNLQSHAQPNCKNDVVLKSPVDNECPFQVVQSVWLDDNNYMPIDLTYQGGNPKTWDCTGLKMIVNKPTYLFGTKVLTPGDRRDTIKLVMLNYFAIPKSVKLRFTIEGELPPNDYIVETGAFVLLPGTLSAPCNTPYGITFKIPAPYPIVSLKFRTEGIRYIRAELLNTDGSQLMDVDPNNQVLRLKCEVKSSKQITAVISPFIFVDEIQTYSSAFKEGGDWIKTIRSDFDSVFNVLPVPEHNPVDPRVKLKDAQVIKLFDNSTGGFREFTKADYDLLSNDQKEKYVTKLCRDADNQWGVARENNPEPAGTLEKNFFMVSSSTMPSNVVGSSQRRTAAIIWDQPNIWPVFAHEISHLVGLRKGDEEYKEFPATGYLEAYGYRVLTKTYKNSSASDIVRCYMGNFNSSAKYWVDKVDYRSLISDLTIGQTPDPQVVDIRALVYRNNSGTLYPFYKFLSNRIDVDSTITQGYYLIRLRDNSNMILKQYGISKPVFSQYEDSLLNPNSAYLDVKVPTITGIRKIEICDTLGVTISSRIISNNSPSVSVQYPATGQLTGDDSIYIGWNSSDADGDSLYHNILISSDNGNSWSGVAADVPGNHYDFRGIFNPGSNYKVKVYVTDGYNTASDSSSGAFAIAQQATLNLTAFIEGRFNPASGTQTGDTIKVYLRKTGSPYFIFDSAKAFVNSSGIATMNFYNVLTASYYLVVKHRNSIETWSAGGQRIALDSVTSYDFSSAVTQSYGSNLKLKGSKYCIYSGDVNQDGIADLNDLTQIYNDASSFTTGYAVTDLNGDNNTDLNDILISYNNVINFVTKITP